MAEDELSKSKDEPEKTPARPLTAFELRVQAFDLKDAEIEHRAKNVLEKHGDKIRFELKHRYLIDDEPLRDTVAENVAQQIALRKPDYPQYAPGDLKRIYEAAITRADEASKSKDQSEPQNSENAEMTDAKLAQNSDAVEVTDAKAQAKAEARERSAQFEARMSRNSVRRDSGGRGR